MKSPVIHDHTENFVEQCTGFELSHEDSEEMSALNLEQKEVVKNLYKSGRKIVHCESHLEFLEKSLALKFIPKAFQIKKYVPGNQKSIQEKFDQISLESVNDEKERLENVINVNRNEFSKGKLDLKKHFEEKHCESELKRLEKHLQVVRKERTAKITKKIIRDYGISSDETDSIQPSGRTELASDSEEPTMDPELACHPSGRSGNSPGTKRRRKFKRKYLQPQPKKVRRRKSASNVTLLENIPAGWNDIIKNISDEPLTEVEKNFFSKGMKFCPVELDPPIVRMQNELNAFYRRLRIKWHFFDKTDNRSGLEKKFYQKSSWEPPKAGQEIENMISKIQKQFDIWKTPRWRKDNLTRMERDFMKNMQKDGNILYMWEDKGSSFVKMNRKQYEEAGEKELDDDRYYIEVDEDPSKEIKQKNDILVQEMCSKGEISEKVAEFLVSGEAKLPSFHHLLKTHKIPLDVENPSSWLETHGYPIRGIISCKGGPTERLAGFVDHFLQPGMRNLASFLQDTKHTLKIIEDINEKIDKKELSLEGVGLLTLDLEKMYTNMTEDLGTGASKRFLDKKNQLVAENDEKLVTAGSILKALNLCIKNNYFQFNGKTYKQKGGVGTGVKLAPPYACLGIGDFEKNAFSSNKEILDAVMLWKRFIDDVFALFKGTEDEAKEFLDWLNSLMPGVVKFTSSFSMKKVEFLDLTITIENGRLETDLFVKPSNAQLYLDYKSDHPDHCKKSIIYSQALRAVERCSKPDNLSIHLEDLKGKLLARNYPENLIDSQVERALAKDRKDLIFQNRNRRKKEKDKVRLIFTQNSSNPPIHKWIRDARKSLIREEKSIEIGKMVQITTRQPKNIKKIVTQNNNRGRGGQGPPSAVEPGCFKCNKCRVACPIVREGPTFKSTNTDRVYNIQQRLTCTSQYIVYLATCKKCKGQYVGKSTQQFRRRHSGHKQEVKNKIGGLGHHYGGARGCGYEAVEIQIIDQVEFGDEKKLAECELYWQSQLRCFVENGGGAHCYRKDKM